jgi:hypothetical protein
MKIDRTKNRRKRKRKTTMIVTADIEFEIIKNGL